MYLRSSTIFLIFRFFWFFFMLCIQYLSHTSIHTRNHIPICYQQVAINTATVTPDKFRSTNGFIFHTTRSMHNIQAAYRCTPRYSIGTSCLVLLQLQFNKIIYTPTMNITDYMIYCDA